MLALLLGILACDNTLDRTSRKYCTIISMLLNVFEPTPGDGIGKRVAESVFAYLEELGPSAIAKLSAIVSDNGSDAKSACDYL